VQQFITTNTLFYSDNLAIMREYIPDESVDLVYRDPPFIALSILPRSIHAVTFGYLCPAPGLLQRLLPDGVRYPYGCEEVR
jgi:hypothetical protein